MKGKTARRLINRWAGGWCTMEMDGATIQRSTGLTICLHCTQSTGPPVCIAHPSSAHSSVLHAIHQPTRLHWTTVHRPTRLLRTIIHRPTPLHGITIQRPTRLHCSPATGPPICTTHHPPTHRPTLRRPNHFHCTPSTGPSVDEPSGCLPFHHHTAMGYSTGLSITHYPPAHPFALLTIQWPTHLHRTSMHR
jgi:hypothetical protein